MGCEVTVNSGCRSASRRAQAGFLELIADDGLHGIDILRPFAGAPAEFFGGVGAGVGKDDLLFGMLQAFVDVAHARGRCDSQAQSFGAAGREDARCSSDILAISDSSSCGESGIVAPMRLTSGPPKRMDILAWPTGSSEQLAVAALIGVGYGVERLVDIAHEMDEEAERILIAPGANRHRGRRP